MTFRLVSRHVIRLHAALVALILGAIVAYACTQATPQQIATALQNSPNLNSSLQTCSMAAMLYKESNGGNTCASNSCCVGIGQLNVSSNGLDLSQYGMTRDQYQNADLQTQINIWAVAANENTASTGYQTLNAAYTSGQPINGVTVTPGMLAACEQFGGGVCDRNVAALQSAGDCGTYTDGNSHVGGQTICSWGAVADQQAATQDCSLVSQNCPIGPGGFEGLTGRATASNAPNATATDVTVAANQV